MTEADHTYDFFILYDENNVNDQDYAHKIMNFLEGRNLRGYVDFRDACIGQSIFKNFERALENSHYVLVLISGESICDNWWERQVETTLCHRIHSPTKDTVVPIYLPSLNVQELPMSLQIFNGVHFNADSDNIFWTKLAKVFEL